MGAENVEPKEKRKYRARKKETVWGESVFEVGKNGNVRRAKKNYYGVNGTFDKRNLWVPDSLTREQQDDFYIRFRQEVVRLYLVVMAEMLPQYTRVRERYPKHHAQIRILMHTTNHGGGISPGIVIKFRNPNTRPLRIEGGCVPFVSVK
jgi:hypothetical protein